MLLKPSFLGIIIISVILIYIVDSHIDAPETKILRNQSFETINNSVEENKISFYPNKWFERDKGKLSLKPYQLELLSSIDDTLQHECQTDQQHQSILNRHKHAFEQIFSTELHLITLTAEILSEFLTTHSSENQNLKKLYFKKNSTSKSSKKEKSSNDFSHKKTQKFASQSHKAQLASIKGMLKTIKIIHSTWLVFQDGNKITKLGFGRTQNDDDDNDDDIMDLKNFQKDIENLSKNLSKHSSSHHQCSNHEIVIISEPIWTEPFKACTHASQWFVAFYILFHHCSENETKPNNNGFMEVVLDLKSKDLDQCATDSTIAFSNTHQCPQSSNCRKIGGYGLRNGGYTCECKPGYISQLKDDGNLLDKKCVKCEHENCGVCEAEWCLEVDVPYSVIIVLFIIHFFTMLSIIIPGAFIVRLRRIKSMHFSFWQLYEVMIVGALLIYASVLLEYVDNHALACSIVPWSREIGFLLVYASLMLKIHRISVESKSRQAQRSFLRDKDLVKYLGILLALLSWQLVAWSLMQMEGVVVGSFGISMEEAFCHVGYWHLTMQIVELIFLSWVFYLCFHLSPPPSFLIECRVITFIIANEAVMSASFNVLRYFLENSLSRNASFAISFCRCHITITLNLLAILGTKLLQARSVANNVVSLRGRKEEGNKKKEESKQSSKLVAHEGLKKQLSNVSKKSLESNEMTIAGLNPEDVKTELRRLYRQLEIYKSKTAKKDVCHVNKKPTVSKKQGTRRFSLHNFHTRNKHQVSDKTPDGTTDCILDTIKTDESSNNAEILSVSPSVI